MKSIKGMALTIAALATVLIPGCGARHSPKEVYYLVASNMSSSYWQTAVAGFKKAAAVYNVTAEVAGPENYDAQAELTEFQKAVAAKPAGILISVSDAAVLQPEIDAAMNAGIPVITIDSDAAGSRRLYFIGTNNLEAGRLGGQPSGREAEWQGQRGLLYHRRPAQHGRAAQGIQRRLCHRNPASTSSTWSTSRATPTAAFDRTQQFMALTGAKKIDAFVCLDSASGKMVADAIKRTGDTSRVLVAWDVNPDTLQGIKDGVIDSTIAQKPFTMGCVGLKALDEVFHNPPAQLNKDLSADAFSPYPVFVDTGTSLVDKSNVDGYLAAAAAHAQ